MENAAAAAAADEVEIPRPHGTKNPNSCRSCFPIPTPKSQTGISDSGHHLEDVERVERVAVVLPAMDPRCNQEPTRGHYLTGESCLYRFLQTAVYTAVT